MRTLVLILMNLTLWSLPAQAQLWSGVLDSSRAIDWTTAGAGTIPTTRTQCGSTIAAGATAATINAAIAACGTNQYVLLGPGTFSLSDGGILIQGTGARNVTLRGSGANATFLVPSATNGCGGKAAYICVISTSNQYPPDSLGTTANWTAGYARGSTSITLSSTSGLQLGSTLVLDQLNDNGDADPANDVYDCNVTTTCVYSGTTASPVRTQTQFVTVTSINGVTVGITPALRMPNWRSSKSPQAHWSSALYVAGVGIENLSITGASGGTFTISFYNAQNSWVKNVRSVTSPTKHVLTFMSHHITVRDSYFSGVIPPCANDHYGFDGYYGGDHLIENNIYQLMEVPLMNELAQSGNVFAYNYTINNIFSSTCSPTNWMQASAHDHGAGNSFILFEGNDGDGTIRENYFGLAFFVTDFRNRWAGWEPTGVEVSQTVAVHNYARARFNNYIGNVLGTSGYHTTYQTIAGGSVANCTFSIYAIGLGANCDNGGGAYPSNDTNTLPSLMRWGNYDTVNAATRFVAAEVPSGIAFYANPVPTSQTLPKSLYLLSKPAFYGSQAWPSIGPDVTGGSEANTGGHNDKIPARRCFESVMGGTFTNTVASTFDANLCYATGGSGGGNLTPPTAPTNLAVQ